MHLSVLRSWWLLALLACHPELAVPAGARITCASSADCPEPLICNDARRCVDPDSAETVPDVLVSTLGSLSTTEAGGTTAFSIELATRPIARVTLLLSADDETEVSLSHQSVAFEPEAWDSPVPVVVTGQPDCLADGDQSIAIVLAPAISPDPDYDGLDPEDLVVVNRDTNQAGIAVTVGATTTGEDGTAVTLTVALECPPTESVTIPLESSDTTEGTISPAELTFTRTSWSLAQTVTVTGVADCAPDGDVVYDVELGAATSADPAYDGLDADDVALSNRDDLQAGVVVTPSSSMVTTEAGGFATFNVALACAPDSDVIVPVASAAPNEGLASPGLLTFSPESWFVAQTVAVTGVSDCQADGDVPYSVALLPVSSDDLDYDGIDPPDVSLVNQNVTGAQIQVVPTANLNTNEAGLTATFEVVLPCDPVDDVVVTFESDNTDEGQLRQSGGVCEVGAPPADTPCTVTFTTSDWETVVEVEVEGVEDFVDDGDIDYEVTSTTASANVEFDGQSGPPVSVVNLDDDTAAVLLEPPSLAPVELGGTRAITVKLATQPLAAVTVDLSSTTPSEGTVTPSVVLDTANWSFGVAATVTAVNNHEYGANPEYRIQSSTGSAASTDPVYNDLTGGEVVVQNVDDDKLLFIDPMGRAGNFGTVGTADGYCSAAAALLGVSGEYKAMIGAGGRTACGFLGCADDQFDWVFKPNVAYFRVGPGPTVGPRVGVANAEALFDFPLEASFGTGTYWTGMYENWQGMMFPCAAIGFEDPWDHAIYAATTGTATTSSAAIGPPSGQGLVCGDHSFGFVCVEQ